MIKAIPLQGYSYFPIVKIFYYRVLKGIDPLLEIFANKILLKFN